MEGLGCHQWRAKHKKDKDQYQVERNPKQAQPDDTVYAAKSMSQLLTGCACHNLNVRQGIR